MIERALDRTAPFAPWVVVAAASLVLAARPFVGVEPDDRVLLFGLAYVATAIASLTVPVAPERPRMAPTVVFVVGISSVVVAALVAGPPVPTPWHAAALPMSAMAALAEEALFRRVAYARLARFGPSVAILASASLFALVHLPGYGVAAFPVDLGAGLVFGWQRWTSGSWLVPAATHAAANAVVII